MSTLSTPASDETERDVPADVRPVLDAVRDACQAISRALTRSYVRSAGTHTATATAAATTNTTGDTVAPMDSLSDELMQKHLRMCPSVAAFASEEEAVVVQCMMGKDERVAKHLVVYDPLDGSQNLAPCLSVGTIFGVFDTTSPATGRALVAAGYALYSQASLFVFTVRGAGRCYAEVLCPDSDSFVERPAFRMPDKGKVYAINEANMERWSSAAVRALVQRMRAEKRSVRWMSCMVADAHRILTEGGFFSYPCDTKNTSGRLRLVYELMPFALLYEEAGGAAVDPDDAARTPLLDLAVPSLTDAPKLHAKHSCMFAGQYEAAALADAAAAVAGAAAGAADGK